MCFGLAAFQAVLIWANREEIGLWFFLHFNTALVLDHRWLVAFPILIIGERLGSLGQEFKKTHEFGVVVPEREAIAAKIAESALDGTLGTEEFVLYLRSFATSGRLPVANPQLRSIPLLPGFYRRPTLVDLESAITDSLWNWCPVVAEGGEDFVVGAGRVRSTEEKWRQTIVALATRARLILFIPHDSPGCRWEIRTLMQYNLQDKTVFVMPPAAAITAEQWKVTQNGWAQENVVLPPYKSAGELFKIDAQGCISLELKLSTLFMFRPGKRLLALARRVSN